MRRPLLIAAAAVTCFASLASADSSYLKPNEKIMWVGDSITAQGLYERAVMRVLKTLYPDAHLTDVNTGVGGAVAPGGAAWTPGNLDKNSPTLMTVMFGVNDTGWAGGDAEGKATRYGKGISDLIDLAKLRKVDMLLFRETHFSHNVNPWPYTVTVNEVLMKLFETETTIAKDKGVPIVDVYGGYTRELSKAWGVDPKYEFTPNFVHPTRLGHAAVAGEILKALGAGLPLATTERGPLHLDGPGPIELAAIPQQAVINSGDQVNVAIHLSNTLDKPVEGSLIAVFGDQKFSIPVTLGAKGSPAASADKTLQIPSASFTERWDVQPLYTAFVGNGVFSAAQTPVHYSKVTLATAEKQFVHDDQGWVQWEAKPAASTVGNVKVSVKPDGVRTEFTWTDSTPVRAKNEPYKARMGAPVTTVLDLTSPFGQPCDAVEVLLDLRGPESSGRYTSDMDATPEGCVRVGFYKIEENGKTVCKLQATPESALASFKLIELGGDHFAIEYTGKTPACGVGFNMLVTDQKEYSPNHHAEAYLTSDPAVGTDWEGFLRLGGEDGKTFVRVGY